MREIKGEKKEITNGCFVIFIIFLPCNREMGQEKIQGKANVGTRRKVSNSYLEPYKNSLRRVAEGEKKANIYAPV